jgi:hypothetical protein
MSYESDSFEFDSDQESNVDSDQELNVNSDPECYLETEFKNFDLDIWRVDCPEPMSITMQYINRENDILIEILQMIFMLLDNVDLISVSTICKWWRFNAVTIMRQKKTDYFIVIPIKLPFIPKIAATGICVSCKTFLTGVSIDTNNKCLNCVKGFYMQFLKQQICCKCEFIHVDYNRFTKFKCMRKFPYECNFEMSVTEGSYCIYCGTPNTECYATIAKTCSKCAKMTDNERNKMWKQSRSFY